MVSTLHAGIACLSVVFFVNHYSDCQSPRGDVERERESEFVAKVGQHHFYVSGKGSSCPIHSANYLYSSKDAQANCNCLFTVGQGR